MKFYRLTPAAEDDLFEIWAIIASDNLLQADNLDNNLRDACQRLAEDPTSDIFDGI